MTQINVCVKYEGIRHIGGMHMSALAHTQLKIDSLVQVAERLIFGLNSGYQHDKPWIMVDFDGRRLLVNESQTQYLRNYRDCAGEFEYQAVNQRTLDDAILNPSKKK
ncbi:MAG: hypothetical protein V2A62_04965 [Candidatus Woesearchaeota archaeon]